MKKLSVSLGIALLAVLVGGLLQGGCCRTCSGEYYQGELLSPEQAGSVSTENTQTKADVDFVGMYDNTAK